MGANAGFITGMLTRGRVGVSRTRPQTTCLKFLRNIVTLLVELKSIT